MAADVAELLQALEEISRSRPDRALRLRGELPGHSGSLEPFELLIFRGFSSSVSHPTAFDPDQPALPADARIDTVVASDRCVDKVRDRTAVWLLQWLHRWWLWLTGRRGFWGGDLARGRDVHAAGGRHSGGGSGGLGGPNCVH